MSYIKCMLRLSESHFNDDVVCLGRQIKQIIKMTKGYTSGCLWYVSDIDAFQELPTGINRGDPALRKVGDIDELLMSVDFVDQFISGVFVASKEDVVEINRGLGFFTEDPRFRGIMGAYLEIRAFDTSYFEIYASDIHVLHHLAMGFGAEFECLDP